MGVQPLVRIAVHDVECATRRPCGNFISSKKQPLQIPMRPVAAIGVPVPQLDIIMVVITAREKMPARIVDKVEPVSSMARDTNHMPNGRRSFIVEQI